jgi:hypothetical protein
VAPDDSRWFGRTDRRPDFGTRASLFAVFVCVDYHPSFARIAIANTVPIVLSSATFGWSSQPFEVNDRAPW